MSRFASGTSVLKGLREKRPDDVEFAPPEDMLSNTWETPSKEMP
jgi:hypothetical protein